MLPEQHDRRVKDSHGSGVMDMIHMDGRRAILTAGGHARALALASPEQMLLCPGLAGLLCLAAA